MAAGWTDSRIKTLSALWIEGLPASVISERIGVTRNAVIGKARRLGLPPHADWQARRAAARREAKASEPRAKRPRPTRSKYAPPPIITQPRRERVMQVIAPIEMRRVGIMELGHRMCVWVDGDSRHPVTYCGADCEDGRSYCPGHHAMVYHPRVSLTSDEQKDVLRRAA